MVAIGSVQFFWECATPPHIHPRSRHVITHDEFYQAFPRVTVMQVADTGVRRPGYEAIDNSMRNCMVSGVKVLYLSVCTNLTKPFVESVHIHRHG